MVSSLNKNLSLLAETALCSYEKLVMSSHFQVILETVIIMKTCEPVKTA